MPALAIASDVSNHNMTNHCFMKTKLFSSIFFIIILISCSVKQKDNVLNTAVARQIDSMRIVYNFPSVAYGVIRNDSVVVLNTVGYRDIQTKDKTQPTDYFHIGSNTKAFTGFLAAKIVEDNLINWDTKFFDLYPELKSESNPAYYEMTLKQLLSHRPASRDLQSRLFKERSLICIF